jgi:hypothetical protein
MLASQQRITCTERLLSPSHDQIERIGQDAQHKDAQHDPGHIPPPWAFSRRVLFAKLRLEELVVVKVIVFRVVATPSRSLMRFFGIGTRIVRAVPFLLSLYTHSGDVPAVVAADRIGADTFAAMRAVHELQLL